MTSNNGNELSDYFHWRGRVNERRTALADSENGSSEQEKDLLLRNDLGGIHDQTSFCKNCCTCKTTTRRPKIKSKSNSLLSTRSESKGGTHKASSYREQLEMKVLNDEIYAQGLNEKQDNVREQVDIISEILKTLSMYAHCLEIRHRTGARLQQLINKVVPSKENNANVHCRWESISKNLRDIFQSCTENSELPDVYYENLEEHRDKHRDFNRASSNFCHILQQQDSLPNSQLRKLELQYEEIKLTYSESIASIGTQLSHLIDSYVLFRILFKY
uniref:Uncharacterized protein n=1 Tax=Rhodnius prolixus TaxID=13249 RepID=T1IGD2_RHOPR